jgi:excisionase family DNA binding protein
VETVETTEDGFMAGPLITLKEAAEHARVSRSYLWKLVQRGELQAVRVGNKAGPIRLETQAFLAWLYGAPGDDESHPVTPAQLAPWVETPEVVDAS